MIIIHETQIFSPAALYAEYLTVDTLLIEARENYQKRSYRNRYTISGSNGIIHLTIPLKKGKNQQMPIEEVEISYSMPWVHNHIHTITSAYGNAPYFHHYSESIFDIMKLKSGHLIELNDQILKCMLSLLGLDINVSKSEDYRVTYQDITDLRNVYGIKGWEETGLPTYPQVFEDKYGFISRLSILDLLFNLGPESILWLKKVNDVRQKPAD